MINLIGALNIRFLFIEPKLITRPSGNEKTKVNANNLRVPKKPSNSEIVTVENMLYTILLCYYSILNSVLSSDFCHSTIIVESLELLIDVISKV